MKLWVQLAAVMATVAFVPLMVTGVFATKISVAKSKVAGETILQRDAQEAATLVSTWVLGQRQAVAGWMRPYRLGELSDEHRGGLLRSVFLAVPASRLAILVDATGSAVAPSGAVNVGRELGGRAVTAADVQELVDQLARSTRVELGQDAGVGTPYLPAGATVPVVPMIAQSPHDGLSLAVEVSLAVIDDVVRQQSSELHAVALLGSDGSPVLGAGHPLIDFEAIRPLARADVDSSFRHRLDDGRMVAGASARVPYTGWTVVVAEPVEQVYGAASEIVRNTAQVLGVSLLLAVAVGAVVGLSLSQPVQRLRDSAHAVAEGDFSRRVQVGRSDELGELASAFNHMAETLARNQGEIEAQQAEIEAFNRELQARVDARTAELKRAQARLIESGQLAAVAQVGAGLAHELNNPLAGILGLTQLMLAAEGMERHASTLKLVEAQARRCTDVVGAMLRFSSGEPVDPSVAPVVETGDVLREVLGLVRGALRQGGVEVVLSVDDGPLPVRIDPVMGSRILAPILSSLGAALPGGGTIAVSAARAGANVSIALTPDRALAVGSARDDWMASGMALWVARRMLDSAGGRLVEPEAGESTWLVELPGA